LIRVTYTRYHGYQCITVTDHGPAEACAGASWIMNTAGAGLCNMAKIYPKDIQFEFNNHDDERGDDMVVPDRRKKHARARLR
jgi:hypothetical protein